MWKDLPEKTQKTRKFQIAIFLATYVSNKDKPLCCRADLTGQKHNEVTVVEPVSKIPE
jgi:hypothetical protein